MIRHFIDSAFLGRVTGWAFCPGSELVIEAWYLDQCLGRTTANHHRSDVGTAYPNDLPHSAQSGFDLEFRLPDDSAREVSISIMASALGTSSPEELAKVRTLSRKTVESAAVGASSAINGSPFPSAVVRNAGNLWPDSSLDFRTEADQSEMVDRIIYMIRGPESDRLPGIVPYIRFLRSTWAHFQFVARYFPSFNLAATLDSKDASGKQNTPDEMLSIAHHLYVLKSYGVTGDFAEFGCFKGYSSAMLSYVCDRLDIKMHIFDSFEGLPPSKSHYYQAGEFRGSLAEVQHNVDSFGVSRCVSYHKGYFSDSLPRSSLPPLMALWMDVDLASSARDVMTIADKIVPQGAVFSHECEPTNFSGNVITAHPDSVVPSIVERFADLGDPVTGQFLYGNTGAFWRDDWDPGAGSFRPHEARSGSVAGS
jgi:O-methyltransferase